MNLMAIMIAAALPSVTTLPLECERVNAVEGKAPSLLPAGRAFKLVWNDEFDGDCLDRTKWSFRTHFWGNRFTCFADENDKDALELKDSLLYLRRRSVVMGGYILTLLVRS